MNPIEEMQEIAGDCSLSQEDRCVRLGELLKKLPEGDGPIIPIHPKPGEGIPEGLRPDTYDRNRICELIIRHEWMNTGIFVNVLKLLADDAPILTILRALSELACFKLSLKEILFANKTPFNLSEELLCGNQYTAQHQSFLSLLRDKDLDVKLIAEHVNLSQVMGAKRYIECFAWCAAVAREEARDVWIQLLDPNLRDYVEHLISVA